MKNYFKLFTLFPVLIINIVITGVVYSKVEPPNYNFSLDELKKFEPGSPISAFKDLKGELISQNGNSKTYKYYVAQLRYKFAVLVQVDDEKVLDFYATLPSYFLHDVFHQSLINRIGKQDKYFNRDEHSDYSWINRKGLDHFYSAACTITCFPIFYSSSLSKEKQPAGFKSLMSQVHDIEISLKKSAQ